MHAKLYYTPARQDKKISKSHCESHRNRYHPIYSFNSSDSSSSCLNEKGANGHPPNSANLENDSTHARRNE